MSNGQYEVFLSGIDVNIGLKRPVSLNLYINLLYFHSKHANVIQISFS